MLSRRSISLEGDGKSFVTSLADKNRRSVGGTATPFSLLTKYKPIAQRIVRVDHVSVHSGDVSRA